MKRIITIIIMLLTVFTLIGCVESNKGKKDNNVPFETMNSVTYVKNDTYNYDNVFKYSDSFEIEAFSKTHNLKEDSDYYVIDNYEEWVITYSNIMSLKMDLNTEALKVFFENNIYMIFVRRALSSNLIKVVYQFDSTNNKLVKTYPYENESGHEAIFVCLDVVKVSKDIYNQMNNNKKNLNYTEYLLHSIKFDQDTYKEILNYNEMTNFISECELEEDIIHEYDEIFFESNSIIALMITESSGENRNSLSINTDDNKIIVEYQLEAMGETCDEASWLVFIEIKKEDCNKIRKVELIRNNETLELINKTRNIDDIIPFEMLFPNRLGAPLLDFRAVPLLQFFNETIFINDVSGFPPVLTIQDVYTTKKLAEVYEYFNEEYFETYSLGIVKFATCSSESGIILEKIKYENNKIVTIFDIRSGYVNTENIFYLYFVFQVKKEDINLLKDPSYQIDIKVNNTLYPEIGSSHYDKYVPKL